MTQLLAVEVSAASNDTAPAQAVLDGPQERADAVADAVHGADNGGKGRHMLKHEIFKIESVSEI
jgi:hypothetical protein